MAGRTGRHRMEHNRLGWYEGFRLLVAVVSPKGLTSQALDSAVLPSLISHWPKPFSPLDTI
jgi:hypothetical protein